MATQETWEKQILKELSDRNKATVIAGSSGTGDIYERASFDLYEFTPNKDLDQKRRYYLAGPEWSILQQSSLLKAGHDLLGDRLGFTIDFEKWFEDFEYEFQRNLPSTKQVAASKLKPWGNEIANRPKKLNLLTKEQAREQGYMKIRFWKDRTGESDSEVLAGTYLELRQQLLERMRVVETVGSSMPHISPDRIMRRTQPRVFLHFLEDMADVEPGYSPVSGEISFRLMDKTDDPESPLPKITKADLNQLATKIKTLFFDGGGYVWKKGKEMYTYHHWEQGYQLQLLCRNKSTALEIVSKVLAIQSNTYITTRFKTNLTEDEAIAYPTIPKEITVLGEQVKESRHRPIADVKFQKSIIFLGKWPQLITLINTKGEILPNLVNL